MISRVAVYCRLSKEDAENHRGNAKGSESGSIENQKLLLVEYAIKQGWQIYRIFSDDGCSGLDNTRPAFNQMLGDANKGFFDIILCKNLSRFSRDMETVEKYLHNLFLLWGIRFIGVTDNVDTCARGGKKARQINGLVNEWYSEDLSESVRAALAAKKRNGQYLGYWCTYGYQLDPENRHKMLIDPQAAEVVREIYSLYISGYGISAIASILTRRRYMTPSAHKIAKGIKYYNPAHESGSYSLKHGVWSSGTIRRILRDETYLGHLVQNREKKVSYKIKKVVRRPREEWIIVRDCHQPIISQETFDKVQSRLGVKSQSYKSCGKPGELPKCHLFAGKVVCMDCGSAMHKRQGRSGLKYVKCGLALKTNNRECSLHTLRLDAITEHVENRLVQLMASFGLDTKMLASLKAASISEHPPIKQLEAKTACLDKLMERKTELSEALAAAYVDRTRGTLRKERFDELCQVIDGEICEVEKEIELERSELSKIQLLSDEMKEDALEPEAQSLICTLTHEIVGEFVDRIEVGEKGRDNVQELYIHWLF